MIGDDHEAAAHYRLAIERRRTRRARTIALVFLTVVAFGAVLMALR